MFIGHFAIGLAAKKTVPKVSLGILFLACQLLDLIYPVLVALNIEKVGINHSLGTSNSLDLIYVPWSHGLVMSLIWSILFGLFTYPFYKSKKVVIVVALTIFSHWILDFITHVPDLPLLFGEVKFGLGLWKYTIISFTTETLMFALGIYLYVKSVPGFDKRRVIIFSSLLILLYLIFIGFSFGPIPAETSKQLDVAGPAFALWLTVLWGHFSDKPVNL